nr:MAG TPA_asm: hypothetical protein [Bacteriophage sp.]
MSNITSFDKIEERALAIVDDYKLRKLLDQSKTDFMAKLDGWLIQCLPNFWQCRQSLEYDADERAFTADLTDMEIYILSCYWVIAWWQNETNNAAQIALKLGLKAQYTFNSESQNFKEKGNIIDKLREEVDRATTKYLLQDLDSYEY